MTGWAATWKRGLFLRSPETAVPLLSCCLSSVVALVVAVSPLSGSRSFVCFFYLLLLQDKSFLVPISVAFLVQSLQG